MSVPKKHHYLPQFYLRGFARDGQLSIYDREKNQYRNGTPLNTAFEGHFYSIEKKDGTKNTGLESWLAEIEGQAKVCIDVASNGQQLSDDQREYLALFSALMLCRTPEFGKSVKGVVEPILKRMMPLLLTLESAKEFLSAEAEKLGVPSSVTAEQLYDLVKSSEINIRMNRNMPLELMVNLSAKFAEILLSFEWLFVRPDGESNFVTNDDPFCLLPPPYPTPRWAGVGLLTPGSLKFLPLTERLGLIIRDHGFKQTHALLSTEQVRELNLFLSCRTDRLLIGSDELMLRSLVNQVDMPNTLRIPRMSLISTNSLAGCKFAF